MLTCCRRVALLAALQLTSAAFGQVAFPTDIVLAKGDELKLISGHLDALQHIPGFVDKYGSDLKADTIAVLFAVNIDDPFLAKIGEGTVAFIPLVQGMAWNELIDVLAYPRLPIRLTELVTPLKPLEAMAMEKVVIGSSVGGIRELWEECGVGRLFPPGDPAAMDRTTRSTRT